MLKIHFQQSVVLASTNLQGKDAPSFNDPEKRWTDFLFEKCEECAAQDPQLSSLTGPAAAAVVD